MSAAAAALIAVHAPLAAAAPGIPAIDQIVSGSAAPGTVAAPGDAPSDGLELGLGTGSSLASEPVWSAVPTGSSAGLFPNPAAGQALGLGPTTTGGVDAARAMADPTAVDPRASDRAPGTAPTTPTAAPGTLGGLLLPNPDHVLPACVGSAAVGSAALGSGIVTGSGMGSSLIGLGSSGSVGSGSAGAGSVAVGSAATGSALLTCMLLLPVPGLPEPGIPLIIPPAAVAPTVVPIRERLPEVNPSIPAAIPPLPMPRPPDEYAAPVQSPPAPPLTALQVMTVMIITIIAGARARLRGR
ncbi:hypothetical protein ACWF82_06990 [Nocardia sp. NPDC055053]